MITQDKKAAISMRFYSLVYAYFSTEVCSKTCSFFKYRKIFDI